MIKCTCGSLMVDLPSPMPGPSACWCPKCGSLATMLDDSEVGWQSPTDIATANARIEKLERVYEAGKIERDKHQKMHGTWPNGDPKVCDCSLCAAVEEAGE